MTPEVRFPETMLCYAMGVTAPKMPQRPAPQKRTFAMWRKGLYPMPCGCRVRRGHTCEHGWMPRINAGV